MAEIENNEVPASSQPQPGQVVTPGGTSTPPPAAVQTSTVPQQQPAQAFPASPAKVALPSTPTENISPSSSVTRAADGTISWTASEFIAHEKSTSWYLALGGIALVVAVLIFVVARDITSILVVLAAAIAFGVLGSRKPRQQQYSLSTSGLSVGQRHYNYNEFRSFSVMPEGAFSSIVFMPLKRFAPLTTIYYAPEDEDKIIDLISDSLPFEERKPDAIDNLMSRIRF